MEAKEIISKVYESSKNNLVKFVSDKGPHTCRECIENDGRIFDIDDQRIPQLPIHPHCRCKYVKLDQSEQDVSQQVETHRIVNNLVRSHGIQEDLAKTLAKQVIDAKMRDPQLREQKVFLLFNGSRLISSDGKLLLNAVSGKPVEENNQYQRFHDHYEKKSYRTFDYSYDRQGLKNEGGIPQGRYHIILDEERSAYSSPISHLSGYNGWGKYSWSLHPDKKNDLRGRSGFFIHGGLEFGSAGCIDLRQQDRVLRDYLQSTGLKMLHIYVYYAETTVRTVEKRSMNYPALPHDISSDMDNVFER